MVILYFSLVNCCAFIDKMVADPTGIGALPNEVSNPSSLRTNAKTTRSSLQYSPLSQLVRYLPLHLLLTAFTPLYYVSSGPVFTMSLLSKITPSYSKSFTPPPNYQPHIFSANTLVQVLRTNYILPEVQWTQIRQIF